MSAVADGGGPDLVLHIGMQQSGATMLQRALSRLRPQLRAHGVAYIGHGRISGLEHVAGWAAAADADSSRAADFEQELRAAVDHERGKVAAVGGGAPRVTLISSDHLVGSANVGAADGAPFRPHAESAIAQVVAALAATRVRLVLYTHRQDRLMELCYLREIQKGAHHRFADQFPRRFEPVLDYADLVERLRKLPEVDDVVVRPFELIQAGPIPFVDDFLSVVGLGSSLDLGVLDPAMTPHRVYSRRGLKIALGMNPHLETNKDRKLVREFLLEHFAAGSERDSRFIPKRVRAQILDAYRETNRHLFRTFMPDLPEGSYDDNESTAALATVLGGPAETAAATTPEPGADDENGGTRSGDRHDPRDRAGRLLSDLGARLSDHNRWLYRARVRWLARRCDAFIVSFPKSGRTWLRVLLGTALSEHYGVPVRNIRRFTNAEVDHPGMPRLLATHDDSPQTKRPSQVLRDKRAYRGRKVILLVRDPRDTVVSLYFHTTRRRGRAYEGSLAEFARDRTGSLATLLTFYDAWLPYLDDPEVLLIRYEDLHTDTAGQLRRMLDFLDVRAVSDATIERAVSAASFERMQRMEREGTAGTRALRTTAADDPEAYKVRRGKVGGFRDYLAPDDIGALDAVIARSRAAQRLGYAGPTTTGG